MSQGRGPKLKIADSWNDVDTLLVDMDGTLLDLAFDNFFWLELVPREFARRSGISDADARRDIKARYDRVLGTLPWYCLDHWSGELGFDLARLKRDHRHLIRYLPMVPEFLDAVRASGRRIVLVTNAHPETLAVKLEQTGLDARLDEMFTSHAFGAPKESRAFWEALQARCRFDPARSVSIEDSVPVLDAARAFGIARTLAITRPDSSLPRRPGNVGHAAVEGVAELL